MKGPDATSNRAVSTTAKFGTFVLATVLVAGCGTPGNVNGVDAGINSSNLPSPSALVIENPTAFAETAVTATALSLTAESFVKGEFTSTGISCLDKEGNRRDRIEKVESIGVSEEIIAEQQVTNGDSSASLLFGATISSTPLMILFPDRDFEGEEGLETIDVFDIRPPFVVDQRGNLFLVPDPSVLSDLYQKNPEQPNEDTERIEIITPVGTAVISLVGEKFNSEGIRQQTDFSCEIVR
jgi:hypothetical protein